MSKQFEHMQKLAFGKIITESLTSQNLTESELRNKIKELVQSTLGEAKKKKKEADVAPQEDVVDMDMSAEVPAEDTLAPTSTDEIDIDPKVKAIQDSLSKALANAKALGDEKLVNQIGNTITMLVRTQVVGQQVAENINEYAGGAQFYVNLLKDYLDDEEDLNNLIKAVEIIKTNFQSLNEADDIFDGTYEVSDEAYKKMDDLVNQPDYMSFINSASKIMEDLVNEGFEVKDIYYYLYTRLLADV